MLKKQKLKKEEEENSLFPRIVDTKSDNSDKRFQKQEKERLKNFSKFHKRNRRYIQDLDKNPLTQ